MKHIDTLLKVILGFIALTCIIPICFSQTPVEIRNQPIKVYGNTTNSSPQAVTNASGTVLAVREQRDITTNAVLGGNIGITNYPGTQAVSQVGSPWGVTVTGPVTNVPSGTQAVSQSGAPWATTGSVTQAGSPWAFTGSVTQAGAWSITESNSAAILACLQNLTNKVVGAATPGLWLPSAAVSSNLISSSAMRLTYITANNTNSVPAWVKLYNGTSAGNPSAFTPSQSWMVPSQTNGFVIFLGPNGLSLSTGGWLGLTGGKATNDNTTPVAVEVNYGYVPGL